MKRFVILSAAWLALLALVIPGLTPGLRAQSSTPDIPHLISYQGLLSNSTGQPVTDGQHKLTVQLYTDSMGLSPAVWEDAFDATTQNGVFSILLGSQQPLPAPAVMGQPLWLGVAVDGVVIRPLSQLSASPYAMTVANGAITSEKMGTDYVGSLSINGTKVTGLGSNLNLTGSNGVSLNYDPVANAIIFSGNGSGTTDDKGKQTLGSTQVAGTQNEVLANGTYGSYESGNVTLTTPQAIATTSSPTFAKLTLGSSTGGTAGQLVVNDAHSSDSYAATITGASQYAGNRTYTLPDVGANANFVLTQGNQTVNGTKAFGNQVSVADTLTTSTIVTTNAIVPNSDTTISLGDRHHKFKDLYLGPHSLVMGSGADMTTFEVGSGGLTITQSNDTATDSMKLSPTGSVSSTTLNADSGATIGTSLTAGGSINAGDSINASGPITAGGTINAGDSINAMGPITAGGTINAGDSINAMGPITAGGTINAGDSINAMGPITTGGTINAGDSITSAGPLVTGNSIIVNGSTTPRSIWGDLTTVFSTSAGNILLDPAGSVGVGIPYPNNPDALFEVNGTFHATGRSTLGGALDLTGHSINNVAEPSSAQDAATKNYVDNAITTSKNEDEIGDSLAILAEANRAESAESTLTTNLATTNTNLAGETTRAEGAESTNATAISNETSRAEGSEATLTTNLATTNTNLAGETTRAEGAESTNATAISNETSRAEGAESTNATAISTETNRAEGAETTLTNTVNSNDAATLHKAGAETVTGTKTFSADQHFTGNVGIGTASPSAMLSVGTGSALQVDASGDLSTSGSLTVANQYDVALVVNPAANPPVVMNGYTGSVTFYQDGRLEGSSDIGAAGYLFANLGIVDAGGLFTVDNLGNVFAQRTINTNTGYQVAGAATLGQYLRGNGTNFVSSAIQAADVPTLNQNTTGTAANANQLESNTWESPGTIGSSTPNTGAFTAVVVSSGLNISGGNLLTNGASRLDGAGNLFNIGNLSLSGSIGTATTITASGLIMGGSFVANGAASFGGDLDMEGHTIANVTHINDGGGGTIAIDGNVDLNNHNLSNLGYVSLNSTSTISATSGTVNFGSNVDMRNNYIFNVADPVSAQDAATKNYVDNASVSNASQLESKTWEAPGPIGSTTPNSGAFTTLNAFGTVGFAGNLNLSGINTATLNTGSFGYVFSAHNTGTGAALEATADGGDGLILNSTNGLGIFATDNSSSSSWAAIDGYSPNGSGVVGVSHNGTALEGFVNSGFAGTAVHAETQGTGVALQALALSGDAIDATSTSGDALNATGNVQIHGITNVSATSDAGVVLTVNNSSTSASATTLEVDADNGNAISPGVSGNGTAVFATAAGTGAVIYAGADGSGVGETVVTHGGDAIDAQVNSGSGVGLNVTTANGNAINATSSGGLAINATGNVAVTGSLSVGAAMNMNSHPINNVTDPTSAQDAATKAYVDANAGAAQQKAVAWGTMKSDGTFINSYGINTGSTHHIGSGQWELYLTHSYTSGTVVASPSLQTGEYYDASVQVSELTSNTFYFYTYTTAGGGYKDQAVNFVVYANP